MKFSAKGIYIEATPEELALLLAPGECIPAMQSEADEDEKDLHIHANIFLPAELGEAPIAVDMKGDVSESDTKKESVKTEPVEVKAETILDIIAAGLAKRVKGRQVGIGYIAKDGAFKKEIQGEDGRRFVVTIKRG